MSDVWIRVRYGDVDTMVRYDDVRKSKLFRVVSDLYGSNDIELRNKASGELKLAVNTILLNYPNVAYDSDTFQPLSERPPNCTFEAYVAFRDVLVGRDYELD